MRTRLLLVVLLALLGAAALTVAGCGGEEEVAPTAENAEGGGDTTDTGEEPADTGEEPAETGGDGAGEGDPANGEEIFAAQGCGGCHVLEAAGSSGNIGPNLDESQPDFELVVDRVTNGAGAMPAFSDKLSEEEIADVAAYVVESTSG